jgi:hypothetical protein
MRYSVQYQHTTQKWVIFDTETFTMQGSYRSEELALIAALGIEESARQRRSRTSTSTRMDYPDVRLSA